jgi:hypothetical protein
MPVRAALSPRLLADLVRPLFVAAIGVNLAGAGLQIAALHAGSGVSALDDWRGD